MIDIPPKFTEDVCCGSSRCRFLHKGVEQGSLPQGRPKGSAEALATLCAEVYSKA